MYDRHLYPESTVLLLALNLKKKQKKHSHLKSSINIDLYKSKHYYIRFLYGKNEIILLENISLCDLHLTI